MLYSPEVDHARCIGLYMPRGFPCKRWCLREMAFTRAELATSTKASGALGEHGLAMVASSMAP